jgi:hypothetical protein
MKDVTKAKPKAKPPAKSKTKDKAKPVAKTKVAPKFKTLGAPAMALVAAAGFTRVKITATIAGTLQCTGNVRRLGDPIPAHRDPAPEWQYDLGDGKYIFNADMAGLVGAKATFAFVGATPRPPLAFILEGQAGTAASDNGDISFTVGAAAAGQ